MKRCALTRKPSTLKRTELARRVRLRPGGRKTRARVPLSIRADVIARTGGYCACGCHRVGTQRHHVFPVQRWPELELVADNMIWATEDCHMNHEAASKRFPRHAIRCAERLASTPAMGAYLDRTYGAQA